VCEVCNKTPYQAATYKPFASCSKCGLVRYCSDECKDALGSVHSSKDCATLSLCLLNATERTQIDYHIHRKKVAKFECLANPSPGVRAMYVPLSRYTGWDHFNRELSKEFTGQSDISVIYSGLANSFPNSHPMAVAAVGQMSTESQSLPFTIIAALEASVPDITSRTSLEIHLVAAANREYAARGMTEEIIHHFPSLKQLRLHLVGPELLQLAHRQQDPSFNYACSGCQTRGCIRTWELHAMEYHGFLAADRTRRPDLIVGLNTGWTEVATDSWSATLQKICAMKVPTLFTAYSREEAQKESLLLTMRGVDFIVEVQENKWRGVIPTVNKGIRNNHNTLGLYNSYYWYVFQGRR
jgi:splicing suppressor protein 51